MTTHPPLLERSERASYAAYGNRRQDGANLVRRTGQPIDDLRQIAMIGNIEASRRYSQEHGAFRPYVRTYANGEGVSLPAGQGLSDQSAGLVAGATYAGIEVDAARGGSCRSPWAVRHQHSAVAGDY